jgi:hypothetical protein
VLGKELPDDDPILKLDNDFAPHALAGQTASPATELPMPAFHVQLCREPRVVVNRDVFETAAWRHRH